MFTQITVTMLFSFDLIYKIGIIIRISQDRSKDRMGNFLIYSSY